MENASPEITFSPLDRHFARLMVKLARQPGIELELAAKLVSFHGHEGNICLPLEKVTGNRDADSFPTEALSAPPLEPWIKKLRSSGVVGEPGDFTPLILDAKNRLYLRRYWEYEQQLAKSILARVNAPAHMPNAALLEQNLDQFFPTDGEMNWQRHAARMAVTRNFCVISGGPGTGKTRTVVLILALLLQQFAKAKIALCAPTGKAAARLKESIEQTATELALPDEIKNAIPSEATTIHRLLGSKPDSPYFHRNRESPLIVDAVIVDEASMVDLALMAKLFAATPPAAKIILLGDKDQLASVEAGAVLGEICSLGSSNYLPPQTADQKSYSALPQHIVELKKNYRFGDNSGIFQISQSVNMGDANKALSALRSGGTEDLKWSELPRPAELKRSLRALVIERFSTYLRCKTAADALAALNDFRILCAVKRGPFGVENINRIVEQILEDAELLHSESRWYHGRPVMITQNDSNLKLFNGDVGILWKDAQSKGELRAYFSSSDGTVGRLLPSRLPSHETVFAMTVHKSQGSEFKNLLLILPDHENPVLTRELIYTGLTRARKHVELWANEFVFRQAVTKKIERASGLRDALADTPA